MVEGLLRPRRECAADRAVLLVAGDAAHRYRVGSKYMHEIDTYTTSVASVGLLLWYMEEFYGV